MINRPRMALDFQFTIHAVVSHVATGGLTIPLVTTVMHYDVANGRYFHSPCWPDRGGYLYVLFLAMCYNVYIFFAAVAMHLSVFV